MNKLRAFFLRLGGWRGRGQRERELQEELEAHFQLHVEENLRAGMDAAEARREAALRFGSVDAAKEEVRARWTVGFLEIARQDVVYALRGLRRNPGFAATAILSLALGIGASVAIFTVVDSLLLRPLPYRDPKSLVMVWEHNPTRESARYNVVSPANYRDWKAQSSAFESMAAFANGRTVLDEGGRVEELGIQYVTVELLPMLGVQPYRGRLFTPAEDLPNTPDVVLLSHRLWQTWFRGDESVIGRKVQIAGRPATVIGVMGPGFFFRNREIDLWGTIGLDPARDYRKSSGRYLSSLARLKKDVSLQAAETQMVSIAKRLERDYPVFDTNWSVRLEPLRDSMVRKEKTSMYVLLGAVGLLLAVACANVANLLLARHTARRREMSVRAAIGAGRYRVVRQLVTESLVLGIAGGALGLGIARFAVIGLVGLAPRDLARNAPVAIDLRVLLFACGLSLLTALVFGLAPAIAAARTDVLSGLREDTRTTAGGRGTMRNVLVAAEVALSLMLLAGAGLLFRTLIGLQGVAPGIDAAHVLTFRVSIPGAKYREPVRRVQFFKSAVERLRELPGVRTASAINYLPFFGQASGTWVHVAGRPPEKPGSELLGTIRTVMPGYFAAMGIPIKKGRDFTEADNTIEAPRRYIVSETFARMYLPGEDPIGKSINAQMNDSKYGEIIGLVGDVREGSVDKEPSPTMYYAHAQMISTQMTFLVRTQGEPRSAAGAARGVIRALDSAQPIAEVTPMADIVRETFSRQRFSAILLIGFSMVALALAAIGIYGVLAFSVTERTREIGVRVALGANPGQVVSMVLASGARLILAGTVAGLTGAFALTSLLKTMLFGVDAHDAATFVTVPLLLGAVALIAAWGPARRASRVAPAEALRAD